MGAAAAQHSPHQNLGAPDMSKRTAPPRLIVAARQHGLRRFLTVHRLVPLRGNFRRLRCQIVIPLPDKAVAAIWAARILLCAAYTTACHVCPLAHRHQTRFPLDAVTSSGVKSPLQPLPIHPAGVFCLFAGRMSAVFLSWLEPLNILPVVCCAIFPFVHIPGNRLSHWYG